MTNLNPKVVNSAKFELFQIFQSFLFLCSTNINYFELRFCKLVDYIIVYVVGFLLIVFGTLNYDFRILQNKEVHVARPPF